MSLAVVVLNIAYVALLGSSFADRIMRIRIALVAAAVAFIIYGSLEGIWSMVVWNLVIGSMHISRLVRDYRKQRSISLSEDEVVIRDEFFAGLSDFDFHLLWHLGETKTYRDQRYIEAATRPRSVALILSGVALIERNGELLRGLTRGALIGEMSFVSDRDAEVDVVADGELVLREWDQRILASLDQVTPSGSQAFQSLLSRDLVAKAKTF